MDGAGVLSWPPESGRPAGGAGNGGVVIIFENTSAATCTLYGYPGIGLTTASNRAVVVKPVRARNGGPVFNSVSEKTITLASHSDAYFWLEWVNGSCQPNGTIEITAPNDYRSLTVANRSVEPCGQKFRVSPVTNNKPT